MTNLSGQKNVFVSFSGPKAHAIGDALCSFLRRVVQAAKPWISSEIPQGRDWVSELRKALNTVKLGIIVITPENIEKPWTLFEAGALTMGVDGGGQDRLVIPLVFGAKKSTLGFPLGMLQGAEWNEIDLLALCRSLRDVIDPALPDDDLKYAFANAFPTFKATVEKALGDLPSPQPINQVDLLLEIRSMLLSQDAPERTHVSDLDYKESFPSVENLLGRNKVMIMHGERTTTYLWDGFLANLQEVFLRTITEQLGDREVVVCRDGSITSGRWETDAGAAFKRVTEDFRAGIDGDLTQTGLG